MLSPVLFTTQLQSEFRIYLIPKIISRYDKELVLFVES